MTCNPSAIVETDNETDDEPWTLNMLAEKVMHQAIKLNTLAYCPTMDLVALATADEQIHIYRLNGQQVFGISNKKTGCSVQNLQWKPNGQILAIAFSDSSVSLISAQTGKAVHHIQCPKQCIAKICCIGWGLNFTDAKSARARLDVLAASVNSDDILNRESQVSDAEVPLDLPTDLAFLDVEGILPKLSVLPARDRDDEVFSSRISMDAIFHSSKMEFDDSADVLLVGHEDGTMHLSIYDFFEIGTFNTQQISSDLQRSKPLLHRSHPLCSSHAVIFSATQSSSELIPQNGEELFFVPFDLRLIPETGRYLSLLASKSTQLQNVLRYIRETQIQVYNEFKSSQELPHKFIRNIEDTLHQNNEGNFMSATFHLVVTGNCYPSMKEWLVEELGERGHKRWEKAASSGYENIRRLIHENLLPALTRFSVLVSRLRGLSRFQESTTNLGLVTKELDQLFDTMNCLQLLSHFILIAADKELRQFLAFSVWLKQEIEAQGTSLTSTHDSPEQDIMLDHTQILEYVRGAMLQSELVELFGIQSDSDERPSWDPTGDDILIYETFKKEVKVLEQETVPDKKFPGLDALISRLDKQCKGVFDKITEAQKRKVRFGQPMLLGNKAVLCIDMRMIIEGDTDHGDQCTAYIAMATKNSPNLLKLYRIVLKVINGLSSTETTEQTSISLPEGKVRDMRFVDEEKLMVAYSEKSSSSYLLSIPYRSRPRSVNGITYTAIDPHGISTITRQLAGAAPNLDLSKAEAMKHYVKHTFPEGPMWTPERLEVNGRKGRRAVCVLAEDRIHYRIFDIDTPKAEADLSEVGDEDSDMAVDDTPSL